MVHVWDLISIYDTVNNVLIYSITSTNGKNTRIEYPKKACQPATCLSSWDVGGKGWRSARQSDDICGISVDYVGWLERHFIRWIPWQVNIYMKTTDGLNISWTDIFHQLLMFFVDLEGWRSSNSWNFQWRWPAKDGYGNGLQGRGRDGNIWLFKGLRGTLPSQSPSDLVEELKKCIWGKIQ
jgi:hypothetical protein